MSLPKKIVAGMAILKGTAERAATAVKKSIGKFTDEGEELVDGRSMEPPLGYQPSESLAEQIARAVRSHAVQQAIVDAGGETEEEANDFDVGDDFDPTSPYEAHFEPITESEFNRLLAAGYTFNEEPSTRPPEASYKSRPADPPEPSPPSVAAPKAPTPA